MSETYINEHEILKGAARALFTSNWGSNEEEEGRTYPGQNLSETAPATSLDAVIHAAALLSTYQSLNRFPAAVLFGFAVKANEAEGIDTPEPYQFGWYLAMMAMGHGVSWFDDNAEFELNCPSVEIYWEQVKPTPGLQKTLTRAA
jgi:hypothetical protein